ncbi:MAG: hypothetical protein QFX38_01690 [Methanothermobacter sp.]|nr:hypothetical protein [Methanothermobacter sp.]
MEFGKIERPTIGRFVDVEFFRMIRFLPVEMLGERVDGLIYNGAKAATTDMKINLDRIVAFFKEKKIGRVTILNTDPVRVKVDECVTCSGLPSVGRPLCHFEGGLLAGLFGSALGDDIDLKEVKCWGLGDKTCLFEEI